VSPDGTNPKRLTDLSVLGMVAWMPDARSMLVPRGDAVVRLDVESGRTEPIAGLDGRTLFIVDASGKWVVFQTSERGNMRIAAVPIGGGTPRVVVADSNSFHPFFSPSGQWLYIQRNHKNLYRVPGPAQDWKSAPPTTVTEFTGVDLYIEDPKISRDGKTLFYGRGRRTGDIVVLRRAASAPRTPGP
jgi:hypothetical protein